MKRLISFPSSLVPAFLLVVFLMTGCATRRPEHVVIISFDGGKPAVMKESEMPVLKQMVSEGAHSWQAQTVLPSITLVSHVSMLTGIQPSKHGVFWNDWQPARGILPHPSVFTLASEKGLKTALFAGKEKFKHLNVTGRVDKFDVPAYECVKVAEIAAAYIETDKPNVCFIHFADSDGAGHKFGWGSNEQKLAFADEDVALLRIKEALHKAGITKKTVILMSADHGGLGKGHGGPNPEEMTIPWIAWGAGVKSGFEITSPISTCDTAATTLWLLGLDIPANWDGKPVKEAFVFKN